MRKRRTRRQLWAAGETAASIRAALDDNDAHVQSFVGTEEGAREFDAVQKTLIDELAILEGRMFPNDKAYDDA